MVKQKVSDIKLLELTFPTSTPADPYASFVFLQQQLSYIKKISYIKQEMEKIIDSATLFVKNYE